MKLLSVAIPCYNSEAYMNKCIESILPGGEDIEILIVDDGSSDGTAAIADRLAEEHPTVIRAIHQENGGHGAAVNTGIENATGLYFKVVDSDDWLSTPALMKVMDFLRGAAGKSPQLDLLIANFVYDKVGEDKHKVMQYRHSIPTNTYLTWDDTKRFPKGHYILMHSVIYRTELLRECGLKLPEHCFYVDNLYVFAPLPYVKTLYYMDVNLYHYYIGRSDQSVNEKVMVSRIDQQIRVNKLMVDYYTDKTIKDKLAKNPHCRNYMYNYLEIITTISSLLALLSYTKENMQKKADLWEYIKKKDILLYGKLKRSPFGIVARQNRRGGRDVSISLYRVVRHFFNFN